MSATLEIEKQLGRDQILDKNHAANSMAEFLKQEILIRDELTEDEARILGCDYMVYHAEAILHNEDRITIEVEAARFAGDKHIPWQNGKGYEWIHDERMMIENALSGAVRGDYGAVKSWFAREAQRYSNSIEGLNYSQVALLIPEIGEDYVMPLPVTMLE